MINNTLKVKLKGDKKVPHDYGLATGTAPDKDDAKLELTAACAEYVNAVAPGTTFNVKRLGNMVADFIDAYLENIPGEPDCFPLATIWSDIWDEFDKLFANVKNDNKWHNVKHVDEPGLKIDEWVKKHIG